MQPQFLLHSSFIFIFLLYIIFLLYFINLSIKISFVPIRISLEEISRPTQVPSLENPKFYLALENLNSILDFFHDLISGVVCKILTKKLIHSF